MGIEEGTFWDEHWVLYGNQFDNKFHILKKIKKNKKIKWVSYRQQIDGSCFVVHYDTLCLLVGVFSPFTFSIIFEKYGFRVIVLSVGFMLVVMYHVLCSLFRIPLTESPLGSLAGLV